MKIEFLRKSKWFRYFLFNICFWFNNLSECFLLRFLLNLFVKKLICFIEIYCTNIIAASLKYNKVVYNKINQHSLFKLLYSHSVQLSFSTQFFMVHLKVWQSFTHISGDISWKHNTKSPSSNTAIHCYVWGEYFATISLDNTKTG